MVETRIVSGFPGIGKTTFFNADSRFTVIDSDSSQFSWIEPGVRHPEFPNNYIEHIKECIGKYDFVLVSSHKVVRDALKEHGLMYEIFYPSVEDKEIYIERYRNRGNDEKFIELVNNNWEAWIAEIDADEFPVKWKLEGNKFLKERFIA